MSKKRSAAEAKFRQVVKANSNSPTTASGDAWDPQAFLRMLDQIGKDPLSDQAIEAIEEVVALRNGSSRRRRVRK